MIMTMIMTVKTTDNDNDNDNDNTKLMTIVTRNGTQGTNKKHY